jgi:UDP-galactopyranose mutase
MSHCAAERRVFFVEEPVRATDESRLLVREVQPNLFVVTPEVVSEVNTPEALSEERVLLDDFLDERQAGLPIFWFYTPMALRVARDLPSALVVYDCMDELASFQGAPPELGDLEKELFSCADLVFTGGASLYRKKRALHHDVHLFPSSVDLDHFFSARFPLEEPADQRSIPGPKLGFFGVIDERMDLELIDRLARANDEYQIVLVGPTVKIDPLTLPRRPNLHYLGQKNYAELPRYLHGWDVALLPFALNDATRFISPTKTLEYLAGGKPVVSTPVPDVVTPYGEEDLVCIADGPDFPKAVEEILKEGPNLARLERIDAALESTSWDSTWGAMSHLISMRLVGERAAS